MKARHRTLDAGVTLVELLVTLSLVAIILTLAVPGFQALIANAKMTNAANSLIGHLQFARSEAVKRNLHIRVCPSVDGQTCVSVSPSLWHGGYIISVTNDAGDLVSPILRRVDAEEMRGVTVSSGGRRSFIYQPNGSAEGSSGTLKICDPKDPTRIRQVVVNRMGRTYVQCNDPSVYACPDTCP